jgi:DNA-binding NarL/FixJ family response regulator
MTAACWGTKKRCSSGADIKCSRLTHARQGLQIAAVCAIAAVILDYHMPQMNGGEVATEIKRLRPQVPIVMLSSDDEIPEPALNVVNAFVSKNEASRRLLPVISRIFGENPSGSQEVRITARE